MLGAFSNVTPTGTNKYRRNKVQRQYTLTTSNNAKKIVVRILSENSNDEYRLLYYFLSYFSKTYLYNLVVLLSVFVDDLNRHRQPQHNEGVHNYWLINHT